LLDRVVDAGAAGKGSHRQPLLSLARSGRHRVVARGAAVRQSRRGG